MNDYYARKRDEMYRAYQAALEMEELDEANVQIDGGG